MEPLEIRPANAEDVAAIAQNHRAMALETEGKALDPETTLRGTRAVIEDAAKGFYLVAERGGERVGQLLVTFEWSDWRAGTFWWIQSVYVAEGARRAGVYRALYDHVLAAARANKGVCGVRLYVDKDNGRAQATYAALGMSRAHYDFFEIDFVLGER